MPITALYAAILSVFFVLLSFWVIYLRRNLRVGLGDGGHHVLKRAIRTHGNFVEYVPFSLVLLGCLESMDEGAQVLHAIGLTLVTARVLHIIGLSQHHGKSLGRFWGASLNFAAILATATRIATLYT